MSQLETLHSPTTGAASTSHGGVKSAASKYSELFEAATKGGGGGGDVLPSGKPPSRSSGAGDKSAWRHNMGNPRANAEAIEQTFAGHPYAAKPVVFRTRGPSPRGRRSKTGHSSETMSMTSIHSEPATGFHDLTKVNFSPHLARKHFKT